MRLFKLAGLVARKPSIFSYFKILAQKAKRASFLRRAAD
jgi:hypothetical protein